MGMSGFFNVLGLKAGAVMGLEYSPACFQLWILRGGNPMIEFVTLPMQT